MSEQERSSLKLLDNINRLIQDSKDVKETLNNVVKLVSESLRVNACSVFLIDKKTKKLVLRATVGLNKDFIDKIELSIENKEGITSLAVEKLKPVVIRDAKTNTRYLYVKDLQEEAYSSLLAVPLIANNRPIGAIALETKEIRTFSRKSVILLTTLTNQLAHIISNASLLEYIRDNGINKSKIETFIEKSDKTHEIEKHKEKSDENEEINKTLNGIPASYGYAEGICYINEPAIDLDSIEEIFVNENDIQDELLRLNDAIQLAKEQISAIQRSMADNLTVEYAGIFNAHLMMLEDEGFHKKSEELVSKGLSAISAVQRVTIEYIELFSQFEDPLFSERATDIRDIGVRVIQNLKGIPEPVDQQVMEYSSDKIIIAEDLTPSEAARLNTKDIKGIVLEKGGPTSHSVILAKSMGIPAVIGVNGILNTAKVGDRILIDGKSGIVYISPPNQVLSELRKHKENYNIFTQNMESIRTEKAVTKDGFSYSIAC